MKRLVISISILVLLASFSPIPTFAGTQDRISRTRPRPRDSSGQTESPVIAKAAPSFTLRDLNGKKVSLSDFRGNVVILDFWATWCGPCVKEIPHFIALYEQYKDQGFAMVGISTDRKGISVVKSFAQKYRVNYPILMADEKVQKAYGGIKGIPTTFVIDSAGKIQRKYVGYRDKAVFETDIKTLLADAQIERPQPRATTDAKSASEQIKGESSIYEQSLAAFIKEIDSTYPFFDLKGIRRDWATCKKELLEKVKQCESNTEFYGLLNEARLCLRDAHMSFGNLKGGFPQAEARYYPGVSFLPAAGGQVVIMSSASEYSNKLKPGTIVTEIDGQNARDYLESDAKKSWKAGGYFSSPQRARLFSYRIPLKGKQNDNHQITINNNGKTESVRVVNKFKAGDWPHYYAMPAGFKLRKSCYYEKLKSGYGYIYLRHIRSELVEAIDEALNSFEDIRGLIVDLRGNGGGGYSREVFKRFDKKQGPSGAAPFYRGDMVVLLDAGAISAGETFARDLVNSTGAYLMGSRTAGSSTAKRSWQIPNGLGTATLSTRSRWGFEGKPIEYNGIVPHKTVEVVPAELQNGINSGIRRAEEYLDKKWALKSAAERNSPLIVRKKEDRISPLQPWPEETTAEVDILADPNAVKARIKAFEGLEKALTQVDRRSRYEVREWLQTRVDNRIKLVKAVEMQVKIEISFIRKVAIEENAKKTTKAIDDLLPDRQERLKTLVKTMEEETRRTRFGEQGSREIRGQRRSRPGPEERRRAREERRSGRRLTREDTREQGGFTGVESPAVAPEIAPAGVGGNNEIQISEWLKTGVENRISLAKAAQEPIKAVLIYIRKFAVEEGAKKTTAAIDGLLLSRQKRTERLVQKMEEQLKRMRFLEQGTRRIRGPRRSTLNPEQRRSGGWTPTEGTEGQQEPVEEESSPRRRSRRR